jgi:hypothetical protein
MAVTGSQAWYIDAWNVVGGQAFASFREREEEGKKAGRAEGGVFLGAPYFEPEWTSNPSTALAAARAAFQPGFWNDDGAEVAFTSLEEVRELVRRAYIAGGGGGMGPDGVVPPEPPPDLEPSIDLPPVEPESLEPWQRQADDIVRHRPLDRSSREALGHLIFQMMATTHRSTLAAFVAEALFSLVARPLPALETVEQVREWQGAVVEWSLLLKLLTEDDALLERTLHQADALRRRPSPPFAFGGVEGFVDDVLGFLFARTPPAWWWYRHVNIRGPRPNVNIPRWVPVPQRWRRHLPPWTCSLGDVLAIVGSCHRTNLRLLVAVDVVSALGAALGMLMIPRPLSEDYPDILLSQIALYREDLLRRAASWLAACMPGNELEANPDASAALEEMVWRRIDAYHR